MKKSNIDKTPALGRLRAQDHEAFSDLVKQYHAAFKSFAETIVGNAWAEEVVQEAWVSIYKALPAFEGRSSLKSWLYTIVKNQAHTRFRKERREDMGKDTLDYEQSGDSSQLWLDQAFTTTGRWASFPPAWHIDTPEGLLQEEQLLICIKKTLSLLSGDQKTVFVLRDIEQISLEEICNILTLSNSNVRVLLHRARLKLLKVIDHYQETGEC